MRLRRLAILSVPASVSLIVAGAIALAASGIPVDARTSMRSTVGSADAASEAASKVAALAEARRAAQELAVQALEDEQTQREASLTSALNDYASDTSTEFAVAVVDHTSGVTYTFGDGEDFETASVVKVEILAALLLRAREEGRALTNSERSLADVMIRQSDNDAASRLWWMIGDRAGLQRASARLGLTETDPGLDGWWGLTTTTPEDQVTLLDAIADPDGPLGDSSEFILDLMGRVVADQAWGVSAAAGPDETTVLKNGWMTRSSQGGRWTVNSVGRISGTGTDVTMAVMTRGHATLDAGVSFVERVAQLTRTQLAW